MEEITAEEMQAYEDVRSSGVTNMFNLEMVCSLAESNYGVALSRNKLIYIIENYGKLKEKFGTKSKVVGYEIKIHERRD